MVEPEDTGEHGVVLANPDVVDAEFDDRDALVQEAIELAGGGGDEPPRNADRDFDVDEEEMQPVNDARYGHGGAGVAAGSGWSWRGVARGGGRRRRGWTRRRKHRGRDAGTVGRGGAGRVHGSYRDLWRGTMSYELARTVKRWTHAAGTVAFDWTDSILKRVQDIAYSASFSWLPFSSKWSKEDRIPLRILSPKIKRRR